LFFDGHDHAKDIYFYTKPCTALCNVLSPFSSNSLLKYSYLTATKRHH